MDISGAASRITMPGSYAFVVQNPAEITLLSLGDHALVPIQQVVSLVSDLAFSSRIFDSSHSFINQ